MSKTLPGHARVVVVGGGIMGASVLYHLAHLGWADCLLLEKAELTSGSTWHAAGQVTHSVSHRAMAELARYATELYPALEAETGQSVSWHGCGSLRLAYTDTEHDWLRYTLSVGRSVELPMEIVGPEEIRRLHPFYVLDGVKAALYTPDDGHVDPAGATFALARGARALGAGVFRGTRVTAIEPLRSGEWRVHTEQGGIDCEHVVNAAGCYARRVGAMLRADVPITNMTHHYIVTGAVPEFADLDHELPVIRDDSRVSGYVRMEQQSGLIGIYEKREPNHVWEEDDGPPWEAEHELFSPDYDRIMPWLAEAMERMPVLADCGIRRSVHGAITHPPDGNMLLGPVPGLRNAWLATGAQVGIAQGPGAGRHLAQWIAAGTPELNLGLADPRRFGSFVDDGYRVTKAREDYVLRHEIPYPAFNRTAGRPNKTSTLYAPLAGRGAVYEEIFGWERPRWFARDGQPRADIHSFRRSPVFDAVAREVDTVRNGVGLMDISAFGKMRVTGTDAGTLLDRVVANRLPRRDGGIALAHVLNPQGTIEFETTIVRRAADDWYLVFAAFHEVRARDWLADCHRDGERVAIELVSEEIGNLLLTGPHARHVLSRLTGAPLDNHNFPWLGARDIDVAGIGLTALRLSFAGELGWELHAPMQRLPDLHDALREAGAPCALDDFGSFALNAMRMEKRYAGSHELTHEVTLQEAGMGFFFRADKGEFIGRDAALERNAGTARWRLLYLAVDTGDADCLGGEAVYAGDRVIGSVSSAGFGHAVDRSLAFAWVDAPTDTNAPLSVLVLGEHRGARALDEPAWDPRNERPKAETGSRTELRETRLAGS